MINWLLFNIQTINLWYAISGLLVLLVTLVLFYDYFANQQKIYRKWFSPYIWPIIIGTTVGGAATSLLYSEVFGFVPCSLCWLQRISLYPQVALALTAFKLKDVRHFPVYGVVLSGFGFMVAVYHYIYQSLPQDLYEAGIMPCLADGSGDCSKKVIEMFGFVTFPFLSGITFLFLIILYLHLRKDERKNT